MCKWNVFTIDSERVVWKDEKAKGKIFSIGAGVLFEVWKIL